MKTNAIVRIILFSLAIAALLGILTVGIAADSFMVRQDSGLETITTTADGADPVNEADPIPAESTAPAVPPAATADAASIRSIDIEWAAGTITIRPADVEQITITETKPDQEDALVWSAKGTELKIAFRQKKITLTDSVSGKDLLIEVPRVWECAELDIDTASADVKVSGLTIHDVDFDGASGRFDFTDCSIGNLDVDTASGDINFTGSLTTLDCDAMSAHCRFTLTKAPRALEMDVASGDLDLTLPQSCGFTVTLETLSGKLDTDFQVDKTARGFVSGDGSCRIELNAVSGNVSIHKSAEF